MVWPKFTRRVVHFVVFIMSATVIARNSLRLAKKSEPPPCEGLDDVDDEDELDAVDEDEAAAAPAELVEPSSRDSSP